MVLALSRLDWATWDPVTGRSTQANDPVRMTIHTAWSGRDDIYGPEKGPSDTYAHAYNPFVGKLRQHQELNRKTYADLDGNGETVAVEHEDDLGERPLSDSQMENDARLFAELVTAPGSRVPNRIATWNDTRGLAWHRLGCRGNFGTFDPADITTWSGIQSGQRWTTSYGKTCPTNPRIRQIAEIWQRAQKYIHPGTVLEDDMFDEKDRSKLDQTYYAVDKLLLPAAKATREQVYALRTQTVPVLQGQVTALSGVLTAAMAGRDFDAEAFLAQARQVTVDGVREALTDPELVEVITASLTPALAAVGAMSADEIRTHVEQAVRSVFASAAKES